MITLIGHGYIGLAIAYGLYQEKLPFRHISHTDVSKTTFDGPIINAAGVTGSPNVDWCEDHVYETMVGNVMFPMFLEEYTKYPIVHIGSGCIYSGGPFHEFREYDRPNFRGSVYSRSKIAAEELLKSSGHLDNSYVLRIRMPFCVTRNPKNLLMKLIRYQTLIDSTESITFLDDLVRVAIKVARDLPQPGVYNVVNSGAISIKEIAGMLGLQKNWFSSRHEFQKTVVAKRSSCVLNNSKIVDLYGMHDTVDAIEHCVKLLNVGVFA
jgi:nucleoside-diphosphate-sugar epimerase